MWGGAGGKGETFLEAAFEAERTRRSHHLVLDLSLVQGGGGCSCTQSAQRGSHHLVLHLCHELQVAGLQPAQGSVQVPALALPA